MAEAKTKTFNNAVPFPEAGEGVVLRFRTIDLIKLEEKYGESFTEVISRLLSANSSACMVECLKHGLKKEDGRTPFGRLDFNDLPFSIVEARESIFDAITCAITGQSFAALLDARARIVEGDQPADPLQGSETAESSAERSEPEMEPASVEPTSST
ncbi:hypothetical protein [Bosea minatitlanensis]|uniref:Tail assembly chaperone n=1 Tax=Bosea minatitlanensis TaxID=128782 RepID=A0ABW0EZH8_9HYPH|nr:hypothetical protein [Bosea minatitlanensis]MCT4492711.1 hypothetical protein [Bosea minatitlanensis]